MAECDYIANPQTELRDFYGEILFEDCDTCLRNRLRTCPYDIYEDTIITFLGKEVKDGRRGIETENNGVGRQPSLDTPEWIAGALRDEFKAQLGEVKDEQSIK